MLVDAMWVCSGGEAGQWMVDINNQLKLITMNGVGRRDEMHCDCRVAALRWLPDALQATAMANGERSAIESSASDRTYLL